MAGTWWNSGQTHVMYYPLVMTNSLLLKMVIEIVDFPTQNGGSFHSYVNVYQRVLPLGVKQKILSEPVLDHLSGNSSASKKSLSST